jgi:muconolactone D-isomerase
MEFLVNIEIAWPPDADPARREELFAAEVERGQQLARQGVMRRLWRVPGRWANWGLWEAADATELHAALSSLPLWPWMDVTVHPLARHVNDPALLDLDVTGDADG